MHISITDLRPKQEVDIHEGTMALGCTTVMLNDVHIGLPNDVWIEIMTRITPILLRHQEAKMRAVLKEPLNA